MPPSLWRSSTLYTFSLQPPRRGYLRRHSPPYTYSERSLDGPDRELKPEVRAQLVGEPYPFVREVLQTASKDLGARRGIRRGHAIDRKRAGLALAVRRPQHGQNLHASDYPDQLRDHFRDFARSEARSIFYPPKTRDPILVPEDRKERRTAPGERDGGSISGHRDGIRNYVYLAAVQVRSLDPLDWHIVNVLLVRRSHPQQLDRHHRPLLGLEKHERIVQMLVVGWLLLERRREDRNPGLELHLGCGVGDGLFDHRVRELRQQARDRVP